MQNRTYWRGRQNVWDHVKLALETDFGLIEGSLIENSAPCAAVHCTCRAMGTIQHHAKSQQCNLVYYLLFRTWHYGQDSSHLTTEQLSSPESITWTLLQLMERNVHAEVKVHVLLKKWSPRSHITLPLRPILTTFCVKTVLTMGFDVCAIDDCSLLPKQVSFLVRWGIRRITIRC